MDIDKLVIKLEKDNYVVKYKSISGSDFENNIAFLVLSLIKPLILIINRSELTNNVNEIIQKYDIKMIIIENIKNNNLGVINNIDLFYLNY